MAHSFSSMRKGEPRAQSQATLKMCWAAAHCLTHGRLYPGKFLQGPGFCRQQERVVLPRGLLNHCLRLLYTIPSRWHLHLSAYTNTCKQVLPIQASVREETDPPAVTPPLQDWRHFCSPVWICELHSTIQSNAESSYLSRTKDIYF